MKYVLRLDYATFAFTRDSISLGKIQNCLAGGADLGFRQFGTSENSPLQSPYGLPPRCRISIAKYRAIFTIKVSLK